MGKFVGYYRVSTRAQGLSGLGLEAQRTAVDSYVGSVRGDLLAEFEDVESGASSHRSQLKSALTYCRRYKAVLVIAKLDRLSRNVRFIAELMESGVEFVAADMPTANKLTVHILAAMAEYERDVISQRTRAALAAAKARGVRLGNPNIRSLSAIGVAKAKLQADEFAKRLLPTMKNHIAQGRTSYAAIARELDASGVETQRGGVWTAAGVRNVLMRPVSVPLEV